MHVRICVECGEEYRPEITICADCGGRLEDRHGYEGRAARPALLPAEGNPDPNERFTERILREERATELVKAADRLVEEGIECRVWPARGPTQPFALADDDGRGDAALAPGLGYWLWVTAPDRERALAALGISTAVAALDVDGERGDVASGTNFCPACGAAVLSGVVDCPECSLAVGDAAADDPEE